MREVSIAIGLTCNGKEICGHGYARVRARFRLEGDTLRNVDCIGWYESNGMNWGKVDGFFVDVEGCEQGTLESNSYLDDSVVSYEFMPGHIAIHVGDGPRRTAFLRLMLPPVAP